MSASTVALALFVVVCVDGRLDGFFGDVRADTRNTAEKIKLLNEWFTVGYEEGARAAAKLLTDAGGAARSRKPAARGQRLKVEVRPTAGVLGGYGVVAKEPLADGELYLNIPLEIVMCQETMRAVAPALHRVLASEGLLGHDRMLAVAVWLLYERFHVGTRSVFRRYIDTLPRVLDTPQFYTAAELRLLDGTDIASRVRRERGRWRDLHTRVVRTVFAEKHRRALFGAARGAEEGEEDLLAYESFRWAQSILATRSIWVGGEPCLVPVLDMVNCAELSNPTRVHSTHLTRGHAATYAAAAFATGEEVLENYGQRNYVYFLHHGFSLAGNTHDCLALLHAPRLQAALRATSAHRQAAERVDLRGSIGRTGRGGAELCVAPPAAAAAADNTRASRAALLQAVRLAATPASSAVLKTAGFATPLSAAHEVASMEFLIGVLNDALEAYPTTPAYVGKTFVVSLSLSLQCPQNVPILIPHTART